MKNLYPSKKKVVKAANGINTDNLLYSDAEKSVQSGITSVGATAANLILPGSGVAIEGLSAISDGIRGKGTNVGRNIVADTLDPLSPIKSLTSGKPLEALPVIGSILKAKRAEKKLEKQEQAKFRSDLMSFNKDNESFLASQRQTKNFFYEEGGKVPDPAIVMGGKNHDEGGNDILDDTGEKVGESEREELVFTQEQNSQIDALIQAFDESNDEDNLFQLGEFVQSVVMNNMVDNSGKFQ